MRFRDESGPSNVEVECLGKRAPFDSPDGAMARECQQEISALKEQVVSRVLKVASRQGYLDENDPLAVNQAAEMFRQRFDDTQDVYTFDKNAPTAAHLVQNYLGKDTYQSRILEFKDIFKDVLK